MIENKLTKYEFTRILTPILELEGLQKIKTEFEKIFPEKLKSVDDLIEYSRRYNLTYRGGEIFISGIGELSKDSVYISLNCRIGRKRLNFFKNPAIDFINDLKNICIEAIGDLSFKKIEITAYTNTYIESTLESFTYIYDSSAFNSKWKVGSELSPLIIAPSKNSRYYFVEFIFNPNCYFRQDKKTILKDNWEEHITDVTNYEDQQAIARLKS
ncbi:MAG: hypothetical protein M9898_05050 [Chitinophagaceae bacterium]|nr:hypothetical protein [Chitinophagaceae bacterium]